MTGSVFEDLPALENVRLFSNDCINEAFYKGKVRELPRAVNVSCGNDRNKAQIACETVNFSFLSFTTKRAVACSMMKYTAIKDIGFTILDPYNETVEHIYMQGNKNIEFLPTLVHLTFPKLEEYGADECAIREISKSNFEKLNLLWKIELAGNQIYAVLSDTFEGLSDLRSINLSKSQKHQESIVQNSKRTPDLSHIYFCSKNFRQE